MTGAYDAIGSGLGALTAADSRDDPLPPDGAIELGQKQNSSIKQGLPG